MLLECFHHLERKEKNAKSLSLYGQEMNLNTWAICKMNLFLHDIDDAFIERGDTLKDPKHLISEEIKAIKTFDRVIANPPFSLKNWGYESWKDGDSYGRDKYGCPPKSYGDLAFVQHMAASLNSNGKLGVVLPHGILFRGGAEGKIREGFLKDDRIEAIIGLPSNLFYGTGIPACILIIDENKPEERKNKVLIINGSGEFVEGKNQNTLSNENIKKLYEAYHKFEDIERFCRVIDIKEIEENDYNLNIARYVQTREPEPPIIVKDELKKLLEIQAEREEKQKTMMKYIKELDY